MRKCWTGKEAWLSQIGIQIKELSHVLLVSNNHIINIKGHGQLGGGGFILQVFNRSPELLGVRPTERIAP